jgi:hypothetical protein
MPDAWKRSRRTLGGADRLSFEYATVLGHKQIGH